MRIDATRNGHRTLGSDERPMGSAVITARAAATFEPVGRSVATARAFVRDTLQGWGHVDIVDDARVRVAVSQIDRGGCVSFWNDDARDVFGYDPEQVIGKPLTDFAAWPHTPGTGTGIAEALQLSRWEGSYGIRDADGRVVPVYASHLRVRDADGDASTVCLLVRDHERAILQSPQRTPAPDAATQTARSAQSA